MSVSKTQKLILVRHAHRDGSLRSRDNGLSEKGREQSKELELHFKDILAKANQFQLLSSPKKRCLETLQPLSERFESPVRIEAMLDEHHANENQKDFESRILMFLNQWKETAPDYTLACSHGDWIPEAIRILFDIKTEVKKSGWVELRLENDKWELLELSNAPNQKPANK